MIRQQNERQVQALMRAEQERELERDRDEARTNLLQAEIDLLKHQLSESPRPVQREPPDP